MSREERVYPDFADSHYALHLQRYMWVLPAAYNSDVLDAGCGSGYGADLLAAVARSVVAVDHDAEAVVENRSRYAYRRNLRFETQDVAELEFPDRTFDLIVSFEVYEHIETARSEMFMHHLSRLCRLGGRVLLSTPNRLVEKPFLKSAGQVYKYHINSVSPAELRTRLKRYFRSVELLSQRVKAPLVKETLRSLDIFNIRHHLLSHLMRQRLDRLLAARSASEPLGPKDIVIARSLVRQSGIFLALCSH